MSRQTEPSSSHPSRKVTYKVIGAAEPWGGLIGWLRDLPSLLAPHLALFLARITAIYLPSTSGHLFPTTKYRAPHPPADTRAMASDPAEAAEAEAAAQAQYKLVTALHTNAAEDEVSSLLRQVDDINALYPHDTWYDDKERYRRMFSAATQRTRPIYEATRALPRWGDVLVRLLLDAGADATLRNADGRTPLHGAVETGNRAAVGLLVARGAGIGAAARGGSEEGEGVGDESGWTPLHVAAAKGSERMVRCLLGLGADVGVDARDDNGRTPLDVAIQRQHQGPFWALVEYGGTTGTEPGPEDAVLPSWIIRSAPEAGLASDSVILGLQDLILGRPGPAGPSKKSEYCEDCRRLREVAPDVFAGKEDNLRRWRKNHSFSTPLLDRCLLCRGVVTVHLQRKPARSAGSEDAADPKQEDDVETDALAQSRIAVRYSRDAVDLVYETPQGKEPHRIGWKGISEELSFLLDHIQGWKDDSTGSQPAFIMAAYWLHTCLTTHEQCRVDSLATLLPTRLIDVGLDGEERPRLIITKPGQRGTYLALSYRWPSAAPFTLTTTNLNGLTQAIPLDRLSQTIRDAVEIARTLSVPYIWVDALCILQDSPSDWAREAARMASVYSSAVFTLASVDEGPVIRPREPHRRPRRAAVPDGGMTGYFDYAHPYYEIHNDARSRPRGELDTRGWCFQERLLARRTLSYASGELFWDCREGSKSEMMPAGVRVSRFDQPLAGRLTDEEARRFRMILLEVVVSGEGKGGNGERDVEEAYTLWRKGVEEYTRLSLTVASDRLAALAGVGSAMAPFVQDRLVAGLWQGKLTRELLWWIDSRGYRDNRGVKAEKLARRLTGPADVPSWSWASVLGAIEYRSMGLDKHDTDKEDLGSVGGPWEPMATVRHLAIEPDFGVAAVTHQIEARGWMVKVYAREPEGGKSIWYNGWQDLPYQGRRVFLSPGDAPSQPPQLDEVVDKRFEGIPKEYANWISKRWIEPERKGESWEMWFPDSGDDLPAEMYCLLMATEANDQHCLCLLPTGKAEGEYRRIGACSWYLGHVDLAEGGWGTMETIMIV